MDIDKLCINAIRILSAEAVQKANSGHPGAPMGAAPMAYTLFKDYMTHNPSDPAWQNRDRFVLSAGHASALLYSLLHLCGYDITIEDLMNFRQDGSKTPGHPEYGHTPGVEATTGPLGNGIAMAVGMAIAESRLAAHFNRDNYPVVDHHVFTLCGDGCLQEGVAAEAVSLAGTLKLSGLTLLYDSNNIQIEGSTGLAFTEDVAARFRAYDWNVIDVPDGNDTAMIGDALRRAKRSDRPTIVIVHTKIGYGSRKQGTAAAHGEPLGAENLQEAKKVLGYQYPEDFFVPAEVYTEMDAVKSRGSKAEADWKEMMERYRAEYPELASEWDAWHAAPDVQEMLDGERYYTFEGEKMATRVAGGKALNRLFEKAPNLMGGSADLAPSTKTEITGAPWFSADTQDAVNIHFGVREHAMAAIANGMALHGGLHAFCATFFVFSDYMKGAMRLSSLMKLPVTYVLTHDSIGVGEDGPTHEPIEQMAMLRAQPDLDVIRPADAVETAVGFAHALMNDRPTALVLTRQDLPIMDIALAKQAKMGGYIVKDAEKDVPDALLMASGSEVSLALAAQKLLAAKGIDARVVSIPCFEIFDRQDASYREKVLPNAVRARVAVEALSEFGWHKYVGLDGECVGMKSFGASAPAATLFKKFGFTPEHVCEVTEAVVKKCK